jgi:anti-anti-sigma regulatory factor
MTIEAKPERLVLKLEGRMVGPWVEECRAAWGTLPSMLSGRALWVDLCGTTFVDEAGLELLREIYHSTRAAMIGNSPLTRHFAEQAMEPAAKKKGD